jgi:hypothetical protein
VNRAFNNDEQLIGDDALKVMDAAIAQGQANKVPFQQVSHEKRQEIGHKGGTSKSTHGGDKKQA